MVDVMRGLAVHRVRASVNFRFIRLSNSPGTGHQPTAINSAHFSAVATELGSLRWPQ